MLVVNVVAEVVVVVVILPAEVVLSTGTPRPV